MVKTRWHVLLLMMVIVGALVLAACGGNDDQPATSTSQNESSQDAYQGKKIAFVDSYHEGYGWSDSIYQGVEMGLNGTGVELLVIHMDTKNNPGDEFGQQAALAARTQIDEFAPDVVIACDDNAQRYLIVPYYKDTETPVVFCGVNWDASPYGYPTSNVTGMEEVEVLELLVKTMRNYAAGDRLGFLGKNDESELKNSEIYRSFYPDIDVRLVDTYEELQTAFMELQDEVDMIFISNIVGVEGLDEAEAAQFFRENTHVPTGASSDWLMEFALLGITRVGQEQGQWSAETALRIIDGTSVSDIPVVQNTQGQMYVNLDIASQLDVVIAPDVLRNAVTVGGENTQ